jgi:hypothetical protein
MSISFKTDLPCPFKLVETPMVIPPLYRPPIVFAMAPIPKPVVIARPYKAVVVAVAAPDT